MGVPLRSFLIGCLLVIVLGKEPLWNNLMMSQRQVEQCATCDERANMAGSSFVANHVRAYLKKFSVPVIIKQQDISVSQTFPDVQVKGGCTRPAYAEDVSVSVRMTNASASLNVYDMNWEDQIMNAFVIGEVDHEVTAKLNIKSEWRLRVFDSCVYMGRKTCRDIIAKSEGKNKIMISFLADNVWIRQNEKTGQKAIVFKLDVKVQDFTKKGTYPPVKVQLKSCKAKLLGMTFRDLTSYSAKYAQKCWDSMEDQIIELRGTRLLAELENILQAKIGEEVGVPITMTGGTTYAFDQRTYSSCKYSLQCPKGKGLRRVGNTHKCRTKQFIRKPDCVKLFGAGATVYVKTLGPYTLYWCHVPMVPGG